jgi:hypothetical protein
MLQYMKSGQALEFRDSFLDVALADIDTPNFGSWADFLTQVGFSRGLASNVNIFKSQYGEYGGELWTNKP